jgi:hypothetical protein
MTTSTTNETTERTIIPPRDFDSFEAFVEANLTDELRECIQLLQDEGFMMDGNKLGWTRTYNTEGTRTGRVYVSLSLTPKEPWPNKLMARRSFYGTDKEIPDINAEWTFTRHDAGELKVALASVKGLYA